MKNIPAHKVFQLGMSVYFLFLSVAVYFVASQLAMVRGNNIEITEILSLDDDDESNESTPTSSKKKFNSRPALEEDDDDSARDLFGSKFNVVNNTVNIFSLGLEEYISIQYEINTPPPQG